MTKMHSTALAACLIAATILGGCADPSESTPDAKVEEAAKVETPAPASGAKVYTLAPSSTVGFVGSKVTGSHSGGFEKFTGTVSIPASELTKAAINVTIDMKSTFSDADGLTKHLLSADFFEVDTYPESKFVSTAISVDGDAFSITGNLTFHGVTKSITFPASMKLDGDVLHAHAEFDINRFDFGIKYPGKVDDLIRENVVIKFHIEAGS
jgi:polyisoprenoid-binding protein YceI